MLFADLDLARRLERAEGHACLQFAAARRRLFPESGAAWVECAGAYAVFDGIDSPITQAFGLGIFEDLTPAALDQIEQFFISRGASVQLEVSPLAGVAAIRLLCDRNYRPIEISSVMHRPVERPDAPSADNISVRLINAEEAELYTQLSTKAWTHDYPEHAAFMEQLTSVSLAREQGPCFIADLDGQPAATGGLCLHDGVALFAGAATIPEMRCRGLQAALLEERMRYAFDSGCDLAMMVAEAGSNSQRNAERKGFRIAYTRMKWHLQ